MPNTQGDTPNPNAGGNPPTPPDKSKDKEPKAVRVILKNGTLGHELLKFGDVTSDPAYIALLKTKRGKTLVEEVK